MTLAVRHAALFAKDLKRALHFYKSQLGFLAYAEGDADWAMLHRQGTSVSLIAVSVKDRVLVQSVAGHEPHLGMVLSSTAEVDDLFAKLKAANVELTAAPKAHRDGSYGFYFRDSEGNLLEAIFISLFPNPNGNSVKPAIVLLAHGSSDPRWSETFEKLLAEINTHARDIPIALSFMEFAGPTLQEAVADLMKRRAPTKILVVPLFLSTGSHVSQDLPKIVDAVKQIYPDVEFRLGRALCDFPVVRYAMMAACVEQWEAFF